MASRRARKVSAADCGRTGEREVSQKVGERAHLSSTEDGDAERTRGREGRRERVEGRVDAVEERRRVNDPAAGHNVGRREVMRKARRAAGGKDDVASEALGGSSCLDVARGDLEDANVGSLAAYNRLDGDDLLSEGDLTSLRGQIDFDLACSPSEVIGLWKRKL